jgi:photosystem II stability/assembly factor-like uncharacterized protein
MLSMNLRTVQRSIAVAITVLMTMYNVLFAQTWIDVQGPNRMYHSRDLAVSKPTSTTILFSADDDWLKSLRTSGSTWNTVSTNPSVASPSLVAVRFGDSSKIHTFAQRKLWYTTNSGNIWNSKVDLSTLKSEALRLVVSAVNDLFGYFGTSPVKDGSVWKTSLFKTLDGGANWSEIFYFRDTVHTFVYDVVTGPTSSLSQSVWVAGSSKVQEAAAIMQEYADSYYIESSVEDTVFNDYGYSTSTSTVVTYPDADGSKAETENIVGGIWYSSDAGATWSNQKSSYNFTALSITSSGSRTILFAARAATYADLFRSTNLGTTWSHVNGNLHSLGITLIRSLVIKSDDTLTLLAASNKGVIKSTNGGGDWSFINNSSWTTNEKDMFKITGDLNSSSTYYIATYASVWKTTNTGTNWSSVKTGIERMKTSSVAGYNMSFVHASSFTNSRLGTYASGAWDYSPVIAHNQFRGHYISLDHRTIISGKPEWAYACGDSSTVANIFVRSATDGEFNEKLSSTTRSSSIYQVLPDIKRVSDYVYAVGLKGGSHLFRSSNKGASWSVKNIRGAAYPALCLAIDTSGNDAISKMLYVGFGKDDNNVGGGIVRVQNPDASTPDTLKCLVDKVITSVAINPKTTTLSKVVYAGGLSGIYKSTDTGRTYTSVTSTKVKRLLMHPSYPDFNTFLWMLDSAGTTIYKTTNSGSSWTTVSTTGVPKPIADLRNDPTNDSLIYIATASGVYRCNPPPEPTVISPFVEGQAHPIILWSHTEESDRKEYKIYKRRGTWGNFNYRATVTGTSYEDVSENLDGNGDTLSVYYFVRTVDNANVVSSPSNAVSFVCQNIRDDKIRTNAIRELPSEFSVAQNYPDPFNPTTEIQFALPIDAFVSLKIYDMFGKEVITLFHENVAAGYHFANFDGSAVASGVYFYRMNAYGEKQSFTQVKKMLLMK